MVYVLALGAALSNALTSVFQRMGVEDAPEESTMRLSLLTHALRRGICGEIRHPWTQRWCWTRDRPTGSDQPR